jgi:hypothetical protein
MSFREGGTTESLASDYFTSIIQIIDHGLKTNSYKFALLRALADYGSLRPTSDRITFAWLGDRFLAYYWPLTVTFRVRQATDPTRDPVIMRFIREEVSTLGLGSSYRFQDFREKHADCYRRLLEKCCANEGCFDEVIPRFHNVRRGREPIERIYAQEGDGVTLNDGAGQFLTSHHRVLNLLAIGGWVKFTEQYSFAPRLYEKIAGIPPERKQERYRAFLVAFQGTRCFYCDEESTQLHIDHVVPWSFVLEDRIWNLILACRDCNCTKSDRTPDNEMLLKLTSRNSALIRCLQTGELPLDGAAVRRDLQGFSHETLRAHLAAMVENCRIDGFGVWSKAKSSTQGQDATTN